MHDIVTKENWSSDPNNAPLPSDFNRIESNTRKVEENRQEETTARQNADTTLQNNINAEASTRAAADTALQNTFLSYSKISFVAYNADATLSPMSIGEIRFVTNTDFGTSHKFTKPPGTNVIILGTAGFIAAADDAYSVLSTSGNNTLVFIRVS